MATPNFPMFGVILGLVALSILLLIIGLLLRRRGFFRSRLAGLAWAILTILPLFGSAAAFRIHHMVEKAHGQTPRDVNVMPR